MHQAHGIEDTDTFDVVGYYYAFNSLDVRIQNNQRGYLKHSLREPQKGLW